MIAFELKPEILGTVFGLPVSNTLFTSVLVTIVLSVVAIAYGRSAAKHGPGMLVRVVMLELFRFADGVSGNRALTKKIFPLGATFFLFILTANVLEIVPGLFGSVTFLTSSGSVPLFRSPNTDLSLTLALALVSVAMTQVFSIQALGVGGYAKRFIDFSGPMAFIIGLFELASEGIKIISFSFRLFGNMLAGELLILLTGYFFAFLLPVPFLLLEVFVGLLQAFIFAMLTLTFMKMGTTPSRPVPAPV